MRRILAVLILLIFADHHALAALSLENRMTQESAESREVTARLGNAFSRTEKRIREVFGVRLEVKAVAEISDEDYDFRLKASEGSTGQKQASVLLINSRVVRRYPDEDLKIALARVLYQAVWPKFRKSSEFVPLLVQRLYDAGATAYAAELLYPGAARWKYAGFYGNGGSEQYRQYPSLEKKIAEEALHALSSGSETDLATRLFHEPEPSGSLLGYRIMKTFEKDMDPKMIQLMDINEFRERLPRALDSLRQGSQ